MIKREQTSCRRSRCTSKPCSTRGTAKLYAQGGGEAVWAGQGAGMGLIHVWSIRHVLLLEVKKWKQVLRTLERIREVWHPFEPISCPREVLAGSPQANENMACASKACSQGS